MTRPALPAAPVPVPHKPDDPIRFAKLTREIKVFGKPLEQMPPATVKERESSS